MPTVGNYQDNLEKVRAFSSWFKVTMGRSPSSVQSYEWTLKTYVRHLGSTSAGKAQPEQVESFLLRPRPPHNLIGSPGTRKHDRSVLGSFYKWLCAVDPSARNPVPLTGVPTVHNRRPKALDDDVWRQVWRHALPAERAWLGLGFFTGLRASELSKLRACHFDGRDLVGFIRKGGNEGHVMCAQMGQLFHKRLAPLLPSPDDWLGPLSELAKHRDPSEPLIPWRDGCEPHAAGIAKRYALEPGDVAPDVPARRLKGILLRSGLHPNLFTPHALRHSFVGNALRMGIPLHIVQRLADHSSPTTTMRYGRSTERMLDEWTGEGVNG